MKLSELLAEHPEMDIEFDEQEGRVFLDGVYLFRVVAMEDPPGDSYVYTKKTVHTDGTVQRGLLTAALQISAMQWPAAED